jgi:myo-inositol-1(or 4)-monophosphatase
MVSTTLQSKYPTFAFIGEETYVPGSYITSSPTFIVDPIDGTTNFVHSYPSVCISLGFVVDKIPTVGVIYAPMLDELYTGIRHRGGYLSRPSTVNNTPRRLPLHPPEPLASLNTTLVAIEWGSDRASLNFDRKCTVFRRLTAPLEAGGAMVHNLRCAGSAALNMAFVAAGRVDVFWDGGPWVWDVAAGWCILHEAGGLVASGNPGDWEPAIDGRVYLAVRGAPSGQREIIEEFWKVIGEERMEYSS